MMLNNLGSLYRVQGKWVESDVALAEALRIFERQSGPRAPRAAEVLGNLGRLAQDGGRYEDALAFAEQTLAVLGSSSETALLDHTVSVSDPRKSKGRP
jgi:tetratricopeptide (TPR) repeat protein